MFRIATIALAGALFTTVAMAQTVTVGDSEKYGRHLVDSEGMTLYIFVSELREEPPEGEGISEGIRDNVAKCGEDCQEAWTPLTAEDEQLEAGEGVNAEHLYVAEHDVSNHVIYSGLPLYYFHRDKAAGDIRGHGVQSFGGTWYLVDAAGVVIEFDAPDVGGAAGGGGAEEPDDAQDADAQDADAQDAEDGEQGEDAEDGEQGEDAEDGEDAGDAGDAGDGEDDDGQM